MRAEGKKVAAAFVAGLPLRATACLDIQVLYRFNVLEAPAATLAVLRPLPYLSLYQCGACA